MATEDPKRRINGVLRFGADDWVAVRRMFNGLCHRAHEGPITNITSGAPDCGYDIECTEDPEQTHERYFEQLDAYLAEQRES